MYLNSFQEFTEVLLDEQKTTRDHLKKKVCGNQYSIVGYDKRFYNPTAYDDSNLFRSVIIDNETKGVVCFSPPKSFSLPKGTDISKFYMEEYIEGTMINVFFNSREGRWEYATKRTVDSNTKFDNKTKTFRQMFEEALDFLQVNLDLLPTDACYSFVLQHPENRIVNKVETIRLYLIDVFKLWESDRIVYQLSHPLKPIAGLEKVEIPKTFLFRNLQEMKQFLKVQPSTFMGIVLRDDEHMIRYKVKNYHYETLKSLRGNSSQLMRRYLQLKKEKKIKKYLLHFPEHENDFKSYQDLFQKYIDFLLHTYVDTFVKKTKPLEKDTSSLTKTLKQIHWEYRDYLRLHQHIVNQTFVYDYFNAYKIHIQEKNLLEFEKMTIDKMTIDKMNMLTIS